MATKKSKGLGRGLEALLGPKVEVSDEAQAPTSVAKGRAPSQLSLAVLHPGQYQPRTRMDEGALYELAESIKAQGIMQPILVRQLTQGEHEGDYEIIAGERRFRAAKIAGLDEVPVLVRDVPDEAAAAMALIENIQREDLNPLEGRARVWPNSGVSSGAVTKSLPDCGMAPNLVESLALFDRKCFFMYYCMML